MLQVDEPVDVLVNMGFDLDSASAAVSICNQCNLPLKAAPAGGPLLRELIKQHHRDIWGPNPKNPKPILRQISGNVGQNGFQWTRLAELVWMPRVSARDLDSEAKFCKRSSKTLVVCPIPGWRGFYYKHK